MIIMNGKMPLDIQTLKEFSTREKTEIISNIIQAIIEQEDIADYLTKWVTKVGLFLSNQPYNIDEYGWR